MQFSGKESHNCEKHRRKFLLLEVGVRGVGPSRWWPWEMVPRSRGWGCLSKQGQIMNRTSTPTWGLLGSAKHWAKMWKLGIDKVHRDVGNSARGPALQREGREGLIRDWAQRKPIWQSHTATKGLSSSTPLPKTSSKTSVAWPTHHTE